MSISDDYKKQTQIDIEYKNNIQKTYNPLNHQLLTMRNANIDKHYLNKDSLTDVDLVSETFDELEKFFKSKNIYQDIYKMVNRE